MASKWKRDRLGVGYMMGTRKRQTRVGKPAETIAVLTLWEGAEPNAEVVLTRRDLLFLIDSFHFDGVDVLPLPYRLRGGAR